MDLILAAEKKLFLRNAVPVRLSKTIRSHDGPVWVFSAQAFPNRVCAHVQRTPGFLFLRTVSAWFSRTKVPITFADHFGQYEIVCGS